MRGSNVHKALRNTVLAAMILITGASYAADIAIVDFADQWTEQACLGPLLDDMGEDYDDITADVEKGNMDLGGYRTLIIGGLVTNNPTLHRSLDDSAGEIERFVSGGGAVVELGQADDYQTAVSWLPGDLSAVRTDTDYANVVILETDHPIFHTPNELTEDDLSAWQLDIGPTVSDAFGTHSGFTVVAARNNSGLNPCILEASYKSGRILLLSIGLDKMHLLGSSDKARENSMLLMENILAEYVTVDSIVAVAAAGKSVTVWGEIKR
jgi:hypothetical protein